MARDTLAGSELVLMSVLAQRARGAHGTALLDDVQSITGREWSIGALYTTLERLQKKGFVSSSWGEPTPQRGGRRKRVFEVQAAGLRALENTRRLVEAAARPLGSWPQEA